MGEIREYDGGHHVTYVGDVVFGADADVVRWVATRIPGYTPDPGSTALGVVKNGALVAGIVFERWNGVHVEASIAVDAPGEWASKSTLFSLFHYPFVTLGCEAITVLVASTNPASLNLATKLGFQPEALIRFAAQDGSTLVVLKMFRDQCRWISDGERRQRRERTGDAGPV